MTNETAPPTTPRMRFREMMRTDILNAAREIIQAGGFSALSMRTLAEAVGVRAPTLYDYFASKEDVLNALFLDAVDIMRVYFVDNLVETSPGIARLISMGRTYREFAVKYPVLFQLVFSRVDSSYIPGKEQMEAAKALFDALRAEVVTAVELGQIVPADPDAVAITLWANVHGLSTLQLDGHTEKCTIMSADEVAAFSITAILNGLIPRTGAGPDVVSIPSAPAPAAAGE